MQWIFDAVRQFESRRQMKFSLASQCVREGVIAFGVGGDELALPATDFVGVYESAPQRLNLGD